MPREGDGRTLDALIERYVADLRAGLAPSMEALIGANPDYADDLRTLLPAAAAVEGVAVRPDGASDSPPGFEILFEIAPGIGGMGRVYAARETSLDRVVAIKTIQEHMRTDEGREFFVREARAAAGLDHPNIVKVFHFDPDHVPPYLVMQYVEGEPLDEACAGRDAVLIARIVEQVARGLAYAHHGGIVHRDIKPANVLVSADGVPHITDFGLAKAVRGAVEGELGLSSVKGTPRFIPPESYEQTGESGPSVDIYALGVTLYELLCGQPAFPGESFEEVRDAVLASEPVLPQKLAPHVPEPLQRICLKAIERSPADRYASALEMAEDLRRFCTGEAVEARPKRYERAIRGKLHTHMTEIRLWRERRLISREVADRLLRPYRLTLQDDSPWAQLSRAHPLATTALRLAGMALVVSSVLWPYYWGELTPERRVAAVGVPTLLINAVGWIFHVRGSRRNAAILLSTGTLLLPLFVATVLTQLELHPFVQSADLELFDVGDRKGKFAPTNIQIALSLLAMLWYAGFAMVRAHSRTLAIWTGVAWYLLYASALLVGGVREVIEDEKVTVAVLLAIPSTLTLIYVAYRTRTLADGAWSTIFFVGFPIPFAVLMTLLARFAAEEWLVGSEMFEANGPEFQMLLMANAAVYLAAALVLRLGWSSAVRFWSPFFLALVAVSLITPAHVAFEYGIQLFAVGDKELFTTFELVALAAPVVLAAAGTIARRGTLVIPALVGFAAFLVHFTVRHYPDDDEWMWALRLGIAGAVTMIVSALAIIIRERRPSAPRP